MDIGVNVLQIVPSLFLQHFRFRIDHVCVRTMMAWDLHCLKAAIVGQAIYLSKIVYLWDKNPFLAYFHLDMNLI